MLNARALRWVYASAGLPVTRRMVDRRSVEADVREHAIVELSEFLPGGPVTPPRGVSPEDLREVHCGYPFRWLIAIASCDCMSWSDRSAVSSRKHANEYVICKKQTRAINSTDGIEQL
jgi:hypothetical protein